MSKRAVTIVGSLAITVVALFGVAPAVAHPGAKTFKVTSTLDRKTVLPHRIIWQAYASVPPSAKGEMAAVPKAAWRAISTM